MLGKAFERDGVEWSNSEDDGGGGATCSDPSFLALPVGCNDSARRPFDEGAITIHECH